jgi:hypothetical protein
MEVLLYIGQEFSELQKFPVHIMSNVLMDRPNGIYMGKNLPYVRKNVSELSEE